MEPIRIESIDCDVEITPGPDGRRRSSRSGWPPTASSRARPSGPSSRSSRTRGSARRSRSTCRCPPTWPKGRYEATLCDIGRTASAGGSATSRRCSSRATLDGLIEAIRFQTDATDGPRSTCTSPGPTAAWPSRGQPLPNLPGSVRAVFASGRRRPEPAVRSDLIGAAETPWVVEGSQSIKFPVVKDAGLSLRDAGVMGDRGDRTERMIRAGLDPACRVDIARRSPAGLSSLTREHVDVRPRRPCTRC